MQNIDKWTPTKFINSRGKFKASRDTNKVGFGYRFIGDIQAKNYSEIIKKYASGILLDLGCGEVALYQMYLPYVSKIYCADWPNSTHNNSFLDIHLNINQRLPFKENSFNTIIFTDVLEHLQKPDIVWREINKILKPNGKIIIGVPFIHLLHEEPHDYFRYTEFRLKLFCEENSLKILTIFPYGGALEVLLDISAKLISKSKVTSSIFYLFSRLIYKSLIGRKIFKLTSSKYPLGYCLVAEK